MDVLEPMNLNSLWNDEVMEPESKAYANAGPGSLLGMRGECLLSQKSQTENQDCKIRTTGTEVVRGIWHQ